MALVIDSHHHYWQLGRFDYAWLNAPQLAPIKRDFLPADLKPLIDRAGVDKTIFVQTQHNLEETRWVLQLAEQNKFMAGVVGWVDLASEQCEQQLLEFADHPKFVGVRHVTHDEPDDDFIVRPKVIRGLKFLEKHGVPFDLLFFVKHLKHTATLARELPNLSMVIDHLAKPRIKDQAVDDWIGDFRSAARFPNVYCKLSGMVTEADWKDWKPADFKPYVETALELFGPDRCMFGTDWPVCCTAATYEQIVESLRFCIESLSETEKAKVLGGTAVKFYGLEN